MDITGYLVAADELEYTGNHKCLELLDNILQDIIVEITQGDYRSSGELIEMKNCSWTLHERYYSENPEKLKWTFYHSKFRILRSGIELMMKQQARERKNMSETSIEAA
jgi:hypothetical protein